MTPKSDSNDLLTRKHSILEKLRQIKEYELSTVENFQHSADVNMLIHDTLNSELDRTTVNGVKRIVSSL